MLSPILKRVFLLLTLAVLQSCVSDVDFEQGENFIVRQENTVAFVHFDLRSQDFSNPSRPNEATDRLRLEFLRGPFIQDNLTEVEFVYRVENTFSQDIDATFDFLSENENLIYTISFTIDGSTNGTPNVTTYSETIPENMVPAFKGSYFMNSSFMLIDNGDPISGNLNFRSTANFVVEFGGPSTQ